MTSQIPIVSFPLQRGHFLALGNRRFFVFCAPQVAQNLFLLHDGIADFFMKVFRQKKNCPNFVAFDL